MKKIKKAVFVVLLLIAAVLVLAACNNANEIPAISSVELVDGTYQTEYEVGQFPTLVGAELKVTFTDGTVDYIAVTSEMAQIFDENLSLVFTLEEDIEEDGSGQGYVITNQEMIANYSNFIVKAAATVATNNYISITSAGAVTGYGRGLANEIVVVPQIATSGSSSVTIKAINNNAFNGSSIAGIVLPYSLETVNVRAFANCPNLRSVLFLTDSNGDSNLTSIGVNAFQNCVSLTSVDLPKSITGLAANAFAGCSALKAINIENGSASYYTPYSTSFSGAVYATNVGLSSVAKANAWIWPEGKKYSTVSFITGDETISMQAPAGEILNAPIVEKDYYDLDGWYKDVALTHKVTVFMVEDNDYDLYPKWTPIQYGITYNLNGGQNNAVNPQTYTYEDSVTLAAPTRSGYDFAGWSDGGIIPLNSNGVKVFVASWTPVRYGISYEGLFGTAHSNPAEYTIESNIGLSEPYLRAGYSFAGWKEADSPISTILPGNVGAKTLTAVWHALPVVYSAFNLPNGTYNAEYALTDIGTATVESGNLSYTITAGNLPSGLSMTSNGVISGMVSGNAGIYNFTVTAVCAENGQTASVEFSVTVNKATQNIVGSLSVISVAANSITVTANTAWQYGLNGISGWQNGSTIINLMQGTTYTIYARLAETENYLPSANTLSVEWYLKDYAVQYTNTYGITHNNPATYTKLDAIIFTVPTSVRAGYTFAGWSPAEITADSTGDKTVAANWTANIYTVTYDYQGATNGNTDTSAAVTFAGNYTLAVPERIGYVFGGWYSQANGGGIRFADANGESLSIWTQAENIKLYAKWTAIVYDIEYTLGDTVNSPVSISGQSTAYTVEDSVAPPTPTRQGYDFINWLPAGISVGTTGAVTFTANWRIINFEITYAGLETATHTNPGTYTIEDTISLANPSARAGYNFLGWKEGQNSVAGITSGSIGNKIFVADWEANPIEYASFVLPHGVYGEAYTGVNVGTASIGSGALTYSAVNLPVGLSITENGLISGTVTANADTYSFAVTAYCVDNALSAVVNFSIFVDKAAQTLSANLGVADITDTGVTLNSVTNYEYRRTAAYQDGNIFGGLIQYTEYTFFARLKGDANHYSSNEISVTVRTACTVYAITYELNDSVNAPVDFSGAVLTYTLLDTVTPPVPTRPGYNFIAWSPISIQAGSTGDKVFSANWEIIEYRIAYEDLNGATNFGNPTNYTVESESISFIVPGLRTGYAFASWSRAEIISGSTGNVQVAANWTANTYSVVYHANKPQTASAIVIGNTPTSNHTYDLNQAVTSNGYTLAGWTFAGWATNDSADAPVYLDGDSVINLASAQGASFNLYATWNRNAYTVIYNANKPSTASGSVNGTTAESHLIYDVSTSLRPNGFVLSGWTFAGWATNEIGDVVYTNGQSVSNLTSTNNGIFNLYALWTANDYVVKYDSNKPYNASSEVIGVTADSSHIYDTVSTLRTNEFSLTGWTFDGWATTSTGSAVYANLVNVSTLAISGDVILYAVWSQNVYYVSYASNKPAAASSNVTGTTVVSTHYYDALSVLSTNGYTLQGWTFKGWATTANGSVELTAGAYINTLITSGTITLYAVWEANGYTVIYNSNKPSTASGNISGTMSDTSHIYDTVSGLKNNAYTLTGWTFSGWAVTPNGAVAYSNTANVSTLANSGNVILYAKWAANPYTVIYNANKPSTASGNILGVMSDTSHIYDTASPLRSNGFTLIGWMFKGWSRSASGSIVYLNEENVSSLTVSGTVILYARWEANGYGVTYDSNKPTNASGSLTGVTANSLHVYDVDKALTVNGYQLTGWTFKGWALTRSGSVVYGNAQIVKNLSDEQGGDIKLYAVWEANTYRITYDYDGATNGNAAAGYDATYDLPYSLSTPTKTGYTFAGWYSGKAGGGTQYTNANGNSISNWAQTSPVTLCAKWVEHTYTISFDANAGSDIVVGDLNSVASLKYSVLYSLSAKTLTRIGYEFLGWKTTANGTSANYTPAQSVKGLTAINNGTVTLFAHWRAYTYTVVYDGNGNTGGSMSASSFVYGTTGSLRTNAFVKTGYNFSGWSMTPNGGTAYTNNGSILNATSDDKGEVKLYALWTAKNYTPNFVFKDTVTEVPGEYSIPNVSDADKRVTYGENYNLPVPSRKGYTFEGWYLNRSGSTYSTKLTYGVKDLIANPGTVIVGQGTTVWSQDVSTTQATDIYAKWDIVTYELKLYKNQTYNPSDLVSTVSFKINESRTVPTYQDYGYLFKDWKFDDTKLRNGTSTDDINAVTTNISTRTYANISKNTTSELSRVDSSSGILTINAYLEQYGNVWRLTQTPESFSADNGVCIANFDGLSSSVMPDGMSVSSGVKQLTFQYTKDTTTVFTNFYIIIESRTDDLTICFDGFRYVAPDNMVAFETISAFNLIIQYRGANSITGGKGSDGVNASNRTDKPATKAARTGKASNGARNFCNNNGINGTNGLDGYTGDAGYQGYAGTDGLNGQAAMKIHKASATMFVRVSLGTLVLTGGKGGQGGQGGKGGKGGTGGNGQEGGDGGYSDNILWQTMGERGFGGKGGQGGQGGKGGSGGRGGNAGSAILWSTGTAPTTTGNGITVNSGDKGIGGTGGAGGDGGDGGLGGAHGGKWTTIWICGWLEGSSGRADSYGQGGQGDVGNKGDDGTVPSAVSKW